MIDRRRFLRLLAAGMVASTVDVDKLLWLPGQKTIFLPPAPKFVEVTFTDYAHVGLSQEVFYERYIKPAVAAMAAEVDRIAFDHLRQHAPEAFDHVDQARLRPVRLRGSRREPPRRYRPSPLGAGRAVVVPPGFAQALAHPRRNLLTGSPLSLGRIAPRDAPLSLGFHTHDVRYPCEVRHSPGGTICSGAWDDDEDA